MYNEINCVTFQVREPEHLKVKTVKGCIPKTNVKSGQNDQEIESRFCGFYVH